MTPATLKTLKKEFNDELAAKLKELGDPSQQAKLLAELREVLKKFPKATATDPTPQAQPAEEAPIYLAPKAEIEEWLRKRWSVKTVKIISGLESDKPTISSPKELAPALVNVHKEGDPVYILVEEKRRRALEDVRTHLGLRDALLCHAEWKDIHKEWYPFWAYFANAVVEVDGDQRVVYLNPNADGCYLHFSWVVSKSRDSYRFARLGESV